MHFRSHQPVPDLALAALLLAIAAAPGPALAKSIPLPCLDEKAPSSQLAPELLSRCDRVTRELLEGEDGKGGLKAAAKGYIARIYEGRQVEFSKSTDANGNGSIDPVELKSRRLPTPVCAVLTGTLVRELASESGRPGITAEVDRNHLGQACGQPVGVEVDGGIDGVSVSPDRSGEKGKLEGAILRSIVVMAMEDAYETMRREIAQSRSFTVQAGTDPLVDAISSQQQVMSNAAAGVSAEAKAQKEIFKCEDSTNKRKADNTYEVNSIQQKGMQLCATWKLSQGAIFQLASAEMFERANQTYRRVFSESSGIISRATSEIGEACQRRATEAAEKDLLDWRKAASRAASRCYEEKLVPFLQKELRTQFPAVGASASPAVLLLLLLARLRPSASRIRRSRILRQLAAATALTLTLSACAGGCYKCKDGKKNVTPTTLRVIAQCYWNNDKGQVEGLDTRAEKKDASYFTCGENSDAIYCTRDKAEEACTGSLEATENKLFPKNIPDNLHEINLALCGRRKCDKKEKWNNVDRNEDSLIACRDNVIATYEAIGETMTEDQAAACCTPSAEVGGDGGRWCTFSNTGCIPTGDTGPDTGEEAGSAYGAALGNLAGANQSLESAGLLNSDKKDTKAEEVSDLSNTQGEQEAATAATRPSTRGSSTPDGALGAQVPGAFQASSQGGGSSSGAAAGPGFGFTGGVGGQGVAMAAKAGTGDAGTSSIARVTGGGGTAGRGGSYGGDGTDTLSNPGGGMNFGDAGPSASGEVPAMGSEDPEDYFARTELEENLFKMVERKLDEKERGWILQPASK